MRGRTRATRSSGPLGDEVPGQPVRQVVQLPVGQFRGRERARRARHRAGPRVRAACSANRAGMVVRRRSAGTSARRARASSLLREEREVGDGGAGCGGGGVRERRQVQREPLHRLPVEQVRGVLELALHGPPRALVVHVEGEVELGRPAYRLLLLELQATGDRRLRRASALPGRSSRPGRAGAGTGRVPAAARRPGARTADRGAGRSRGSSPHPVQQRPERLAPEHAGPQHQRVDEQADQASVSGRSRFPVK